MKIRYTVIITALAIALSLAGCAGGDTPMPQPEPTASNTPAGASAVQEVESPFLLSGHCSACHSNLVDDGGENYDFVRLWSASMHANASYDPYYLATVRSEVEHHPELRETLEETCAACHTPMASVTAKIADRPIQLLDEGFTNPENALHALAFEAVSCSMCHQVEDKNLGSPESFSGQYSVNLTAQPGERPLYGPFKLDQQWLDVKKQATGYLATQTEHLAKPELCAICHTLHTPIIGPDGKPTGNVFPEQMQYLEWQNSIYKNGVTCQNCHMPVLNSDARLTGLGTPDRPAVNQHQFLGSNAYMMTLLEANTEEIFVNASPEELKAAAQRNLEFLQNRAAAINLTGQIEGGDLILEVKLNNMAGHKMPSGFPSRRAWLHLSVTDAGGQVLFESGEWDTASGKITGNDNDTDASQFEPHYDVITLPDQVQIYEAILGTSEAKVTTELIKSFSYLKDNRLLPSGFDKANAGKDILVAGEALVDDNFTGGSDTVTYRIPTGQANRPFTVSVELAFQTIGYRWGLNVSEEETEEAAAFRRYFTQTPPEPAILIRAEKRIE